MVGKNNLLVQFEDGKKKYISSVSLSCVCLKEEVYLEINEPISDLYQKEQGILLIIGGYPVV